MLRKEEKDVSSSLERRVGTRPTCSNSQQVQENLKKIGIYIFLSKRLFFKMEIDWGWGGQAIGLLLNKCPDRNVEVQLSDLLV